jgi:hypothetical protein
MDGCPEGGRQPEGWWKASDGRWYPASLVRHPAARHEAGAGAASSTSPPAEGGGRTTRRVWLTWAVLLVPLVGGAGLLLVMIGLATGSRLGRIDTAGEDVAGRPGATPTVPSPTTAPAGPEGAPDAPGLPGPPAPPDDGRPPAAEATPSDGPPAGSGRPSDASGGAGTGVASRASPGSTRPAGPDAASGSPDVPGPAPGPPGRAPVASVPTHADQCLDGGWAALGDDQGHPFGDVGECVAFVWGSDG